MNRAFVMGFNGGFYGGFSTVTGDPQVPIFDGGLFVNGGFETNLTPWLQTGITYVWVDGLAHTDTPTVAGDSLFQTFTLSAGDVYEIRGVIVNGTAPNYLFQGVDTGVEVGTVEQFVITADGSYSFGVIAPIGLGFDLDNLRLVFDRNVGIYDFQIGGNNSVTEVYLGDGDWEITQTGVGTMGDNGIAVGHYIVPHAPVTIAFDAEIVSGDFVISHYYDGSAIVPLPAPYTVVDGANSIDIPLASNASGWVGMYDEDIEASVIIFRNTTMFITSELVTNNGITVTHNGEVVTHG